MIKELIPYSELVLLYYVILTILSVNWDRDVS